MNHAAAIKILQEMGISRLAGFEGCLCASCAVQGVSIDVGCGKVGEPPHDEQFSGVTVRAHSRHLDANLSDLQLVADEVAAQITREGRRVRTRLCSYEQDKNAECIYCGRPRQDRLGYFCDAHMNEESRRGW